MHKLNELMGCTVEAKDGDAGKINDFHFDTETWIVRFAVVQAGDLFSDLRVLVPVKALKEPGIVPGRIGTHLTVEEVHRSPDIDVAGHAMEKPRQLYGVKSVTRYRLEASDGAIGHIADFLADSQWTIRYVLVDTGHWLPGRKVLIAPEWIQDFRDDPWKEKSMAIVDHTRAQIQASPEYKDGVPLERAYEEELYDHYSREKYWGSQWKTTRRGAA